MIHKVDLLESLIDLDDPLRQRVMDFAVPLIKRNKPPPINMISLPVISKVRIQ